ncbi:site-specific DNA-methyltransferase [Rhizorhabdus wittichii]|uniref:site-specific DNA-methyltransferase n=1 Tax=Rhizorhabdus wittichii TaxID=160791 RepID=UPI00037EEB81|nr:DNA methyltransferase [Rhizorhabdus wittichii]
MALQLVSSNISSLKPWPNNPRTHSKKQLKQLEKSIEEFGFTNPVLVSHDGYIIAGHGRVAAAQSLGWTEVPTILLPTLSQDQLRALVIADNKLALNAGWDEESLAIELQALVDANYDLHLTAFELPEIDFILDEAADADPTGSNHPDDDVTTSSGPAVTRSGDLWHLGRHKLLCGDAQEASAFALLLGDERPHMAFLDAPYNVKIDGNVCGLGSVKHAEFAMASGEMSEAEFTAFLSVTHGNVASVMRDGAIIFSCMDWRHMGEMLAAGKSAFTELKNLIVWNKTNGGMGSFYRSKHELIFVFKQGTAEHTNNFGLGGSGRYRTNVWDYAGISSMGSNRADELAMHPTVKPVAMIADAIRDCSKRGETILDCFGGSGASLIAAHRTGRCARLIEYEPVYCDTIIQRWEKLTGKAATLAADGRAFEDVADDRSGTTGE